MRNLGLMRSSMMQLMAWLAEGKIHMPISHRYSLCRPVHNSSLVGCSRQGPCAARGSSCPVWRSQEPHVHCAGVGFAVQLLYLHAMLQLTASVPSLHLCSVLAQAGPVMCRVPLERAPDAYKALLTRQNIGKVLLLPGQGASRL